MPKGRYSDTGVVDDRYYASFKLPVEARGFRELDLLNGVRTFEYTYKKGDRLDHLAARFFNEDSYWWVIAIVNGIAYPFASGGLVPGKTLKIPVDPQDVFEKIFR